MFNDISEHELNKCARCELFFITIPLIVPELSCTFTDVGHPESELSLTPKTFLQSVSDGGCYGVTKFLGVCLAYFRTIFDDPVDVLN